MEFLFFCFLSLFFSCAKDQESIVNHEEIDLDEPTIEEITFNYKGISYFSSCIDTEEGLYIVEEDVRDVWEVLKNIPDLASVVEMDGTISYFDTYEEVKEYLNIIEKEEDGEEILTKAYKDCLQLLLWENTGCKKLMEEVFTTAQTYSNPHMAKRDKLSSLELYHHYADIRLPLWVTLYDYYDFVGASITFRESLPIVANPLRVSNLKNYKMPDGRNWNDEAASYKFGY